MARIQVALPVPVPTAFDYGVGEGMATPPPGARVRVPFGRRHLVGVVLGASDGADDDRYTLKPLDAVLDETPLLPPALLALCRWCTDYYHHPIGEVVATALPPPLRTGRPATRDVTEAFHLTAEGRDALARLPARATAQRALLERLGDTPQTRVELAAAALAGPLSRARSQGWIEARPARPQPPPPESGPVLTPAQATALADLEAAPAGYSVSLLDGVTGSGKTELYLRLAATAVAAGRQVLALAPEIGLTPQLAARFEARFPGRVGCYHSGMGEAERTQTWLAAAAGELDIVVGTRSAVFVPLARPGLIVVDEEHDTSYKQQEGLRYSARDLAVLRGREESVPVVLGSATPSLESLHNAGIGRGEDGGARYRHIRLAARTSRTAAPRRTVLDVRGLPLTQGLSAPLLAAVQRHLDDGGQVLLFINRRGFAPVLLCHACGWIAPCPHCNARLTLHRGRARMLCHHCGYQTPPPQACPDCGTAPLTPVGQGTERIEDTLRKQFPGRRVERVDSDRARSAGALDRLFEDVRSGAIDILVGTQILAKGHDFAGLTLAALVDADQALYGSDFRALERMGQLVTQVGGRVGRADRPGEVLLQTHQPDHPQLQRLLREGYPALATSLLAERALLALPPSAHLALLRADAPDPGVALTFLDRARQRLEGAAGVEVLGPIPAPMERRAGRHRAQLLLKSTQRPALHRLLKGTLADVAKIKAPRALRWSLDIDPGDLF